MMDNPATALVIDDDFLMRGKLAEGLRREQVGVIYAATDEEALRALGSGAFELVFRDIGIPVKSVDAPFQIVMTSFARIDDAIAQVHAGQAYDYLIKPFSEKQVRIVFSRIRELLALKLEVKLLKEGAVAELPSAELPGAAAAEPPRFETTNLEEIEKRMILHVMDETGGSRNLMADQLGISVRTLRNKLNKYRDEGLLQAAC